MSINFSDLQFIIQKSQEVQRLHQTQQHQARVDQQQFAKKFDEEVEKKREIIEKDEKVEPVHFEKDQRNSQNFNAHKKKDEKEEEIINNDPDSGNFIDLKA